MAVASVESAATPAERPFEVVNSAGLRLRGWVSGAADGPLGVFVHGFRSNMDGNKSLAFAEHARNRGYAWARFDMAGHGRSEGSFDDFRLSGALDDLQTVLDAFGDRPVALVGSSLGGWLSVLCAERRAQQIAALILIAPAFNFLQYYLDGLSAEDLDAWLTSGRRWFPDLYEGGQYSLDYGVVEEAPMFDVLNREVWLAAPVRLLHGALDDVVPVGASERFARNVRADDIRLDVYSDGYHRLSECVPDACRYLDELWPR